MVGEDECVCDDHVLSSANSKDNDFSDIVWSQGIDASGGGLALQAHLVSRPYLYTASALDLSP